MKFKMTGAAMLAFGLAGCAVSAEPELLSKETLADNYCHIRFRAAESSDPARPQEPGNIVDFYGPCNVTPTSGDQILKLQREKYHRFEREYEDR